MTTNETRPAATGNAHRTRHRARGHNRPGRTSPPWVPATPSPRARRARPRGRTSPDPTPPMSTPSKAIHSSLTTGAWTTAHAGGVVQGDFIDEPRKAVTDADALVGEILDDLSETFHGQRRSLEQQWEDDKSTTEDMRLALRRYRTFFDRLLSL